MSESQLIEYKEYWRDEYLKWICGFANAQGGILYIGKRDDGSVCGVADSKKLMEDIPNKVRDALGLIVDVDLITENGLDVIKITVEENPSCSHGHSDGKHRCTCAARLCLRRNSIRASISGSCS